MTDLQHFALAAAPHPDQPLGDARLDEALQELVQGVVGETLNPIPPQTLPPAGGRSGGPAA